MKLASKIIKNSSLMTDSRPKIIFFGNGPLANFSLKILSFHFDIIFHAKTKADLITVKSLKLAQPEAFGILASFGALIKPDLLEIFAPTSIINLHPSNLPAYRGPSPIETAILNGDQTFSISIMQLAKEVDAGPIYYQTTLKSSDFSQPLPEKSEIYQKLAETGANWLAQNLNHLPQPTPQNHQNATFTRKFTSTDSPLLPAEKTAQTLLNQIRAFQNFPKSRYQFFGTDCIILKAHLATPAEIAQISSQNPKNHILHNRKLLALFCAENSYLVIDQLQPAGKKPMSAPAFLNGYAK